MKIGNFWDVMSCRYLPGFGRKDCLHLQGKRVQSSYEIYLNIYQTHGVTSQERVFFIVSAERTLYFTEYINVLKNKTRILMQVRKELSVQVKRDKSKYRPI